MSNSATLLTVARQAPLSMGFSRHEYWSELPFLPPEDLPTQEMKLPLLHLLYWWEDSLPLGKLVKLENEINK